MIKMRIKELIFIVLVVCSTAYSFAQRSPDGKVRQSIIDVERKLKSDPGNYTLKLQLIQLLIDNSDYPKAKALLSVLLNSNLKDQKRLVEIYLLQARVYSLMNANNESISCLLKAKDAAYLDENYEGVIRSGVQLIELYRKVAEYQKAEKTYFEYCYLAKKYSVNNPLIWNGLYNRFSAVANETGRARTSIKYSELALVEARKVKDSIAIAISYNELGFSYKNLRNNDKSLESYRAAEKIYQNAGAFRDLVHVKMNILYLLAHGELITHEEIAHSAREILKLIEDQNVDYPKSGPLELIRNYYAATNQYLKAYYADNDYHTAKADEARQLKESEMTEILEQYQNSKLKEENEVIKLKSLGEEQSLKSTRIQLSIVIVSLIILAGFFFILNYYYRKSKRQNKLLDEQNVQKSLLIQEIHHRVKNNLQFVHSMIEMEKGSLPNDEQKSLNDLSRRINAMSLIHEQLYLSNDQEGINIQVYINSLMKHTSYIFANEQTIEILVDVPSMDIPVEKALPIGIICAELFNNSVKHAFQDHSSPQFHISLTKSNENYRLIVADNGKQTKDIVEANKITPGLGTRLVDIFSRQLKGSYTITKLDGYAYQLDFDL